jgi:hypothetical protein
MAVIKGNTADFTIATDAVAEANAWTLDVSQEYIDTTTFGDTTKEMTPTFATWTGTATAKYDITDTAGQLALQTAWLAGSLVSDVRFSVDGTAYYHGDAYVSATIGAAVDGIVDVSYAIVGASALTYHAS